MIRSVAVKNYLGESLTLELSNPEASGFLIKEIEGLGPPKADINQTEVASGDGSVYNSARATYRNIVITLYPLLKPTVEEMRHISYKYFPVKKNLTLTIETDSRICSIEGYVESNEPDIFEEEEIIQVSIICPSPYFYDGSGDGYSTKVFYGVEAEFEFPFENNSLSEDLIEFGSIENKQEENIYYDGESEVGFEIIMHAIGEVRDITIFNTITRERMHIDTTKLASIMGSGISDGDTITISTVKGEKSINILRNGVYTNILNALDKDTDWFQLHKGDNRFAYICEYGAEDLEFQIRYKVLYEGV